MSPCYQPDTCKKKNCFILGTLGTNLGCTNRTTPPRPSLHPTAPSGLLSLSQATTGLVAGQDYCSERKEGGDRGL